MNLVFGGSAWRARHIIRYPGDFFDECSGAGKLQFLAMSYTADFEFESLV